MSVSLIACSGAISFSTPVEVSACTTASARAWGAAAWASSSRWGSIAVPHSASTRTTVAPARRATSHIRSPNTPLTPTITVSSGSTRLTKHASMPADPVPEIGKVSALLVPNTARSRSQVSSRIVKNSGSRWPSSGCVNAATTSGYGLDGPGPMSKRSGSDIAARYCSGGVGHAAELALEVGDGFVRFRHQGPSQEGSFASNAGHDGVRDLRPARRNRVPHRPDRLVRSAGRDPTAPAEAQSLVDPHQVFPRRNLIGCGLVRIVDGLRDGTHFVGTKPTEHLDKVLELHTNATARCSPGLRDTSVRRDRAPNRPECPTRW